MTALLPCSHLCDACTDDSAGVSAKVQRCVSRQKRKTQLALVTLKNSRQSLFVPELLVPDGWSTATLSQPRTLYKVVAAVDGRLVSIYDGVTQYKLGQTLHAKRGGAAWAPFDACYFAIPTMQQAASAILPQDSQLAKAPRMLIEVRCHGKGYLHRTDVWAVPHMTTVGVIGQITEAAEVAIPARYAGW